jgi:hypothetical protein
MSSRGSMNNTAPKSRSVTSKRIVTNSSNYRPADYLRGEMIRGLALRVHR